MGKRSDSYKAGINSAVPSALHLPFSLSFFYEWAALSRKKVRPPVFGIKRQTGYWANGTDWIPAPTPTRYADIYVFAWHGKTDETCDHADPAQWRFHVVRTTALPDTDTVSLPSLAGAGIRSGRLGGGRIGRTQCQTVSANARPGRHCRRPHRRRLEDVDLLRRHRVPQQC